MNAIREALSDDRRAALSRRAAQTQLFPAMLTALTAGLGVAFAAYGFLRWMTPVDTSRAAAEIDVTRVALSVVAGAGGVVALVIAYRRQRDLEQSRFVERFDAAARQLGDVDAAVRIAGVYAMAGIADDSESPHRQQCIDALCGYLRLPYDATHGASGRTKQIIKKPRIENGRVRGEIEEHFEFRQNDKEVRSTILRVIADHLMPSAEHSWSASNFDFRTAHLEDVDFSRAIFLGAARFGSTTFFGTARFDSTEFAGDVDFADTMFTGPARFSYARFLSDAMFHSATFSGNASFAGVNISGIARFKKASFARDAEFYMAKFFSDSWFQEATFSGDAEFSRVDFSGNALFDHAKFSCKAIFTYTKFLAETRFQTATFVGSAEFTAVKFSDYNTWFNSIEFSDIAVFNSALFAGPTWFDDSKFAGTTRFNDAIFQADAWFNNTKFLTDSSFNRTNFSGSTLFRRASFGTGNITFANPRRWGPPTPQFDWDDDVSQKPSNVEPQDWPPLVASGGG